MAGTISPATLERIRAASDIVDVIGSYLPLKKAGANFVALCPFHKEKTPSFNVNPHRQIFHCFGCHKGGDVFTFVKEYENIGFMDAVRRLADRAKIPLEFDQNPARTAIAPSQGPIAPDSRANRATLAELPAQRSRRPGRPRLSGQTRRLAGGHQTLPPRRRAANLGRHGQLGQKQRLRACRWSKRPGLIRAAREGNDANDYYDRFRGRLMFPICDEQGRVIGFSGRVLSGDEKTAKYVNSPETPIFTKSKIFFGLDKSKRAILDAGFAIVCEGQLDLIACFMAGVQNVVAPQGTAFTDQHARILKRYADEVVLCFDSDEAGQNAAVRSLDHLLASGLAVRVAVVPAPHDPDSFIKANGGEAFRKLDRKRRGIFRLLFEPALRARMTRTATRAGSPFCAAWPRPSTKPAMPCLIDTYAQKTALRLGVSPEAVRAEFKKTPAVQSPQSGVQRTNRICDRRTGNIDRPSPHEFHLLKLLLLHDELVAWAALHLDVNWISHPLVRQIVAQRLAAQTNETWKSLAAFLDECESPEMRSLVTEAVAEDRKIPNPEQQLADVALKLRNQFLDRQIAALTQKISQPEMSEAEQSRIAARAAKIARTKARAARRRLN